MAKEKNLNVKIGKNEKGLERKYEVWNCSKHAPCKEHSDRANENQLKKFLHQNGWTNKCLTRHCNCYVIFAVVVYAIFLRFLRQFFPIWEKRCPRQTVKGTHSWRELKEFMITVARVNWDQKATSWRSEIGSTYDGERFSMTIKNARDSA